MPDVSQGSVCMMDNYICLIFFFINLAQVKALILYYWHEVNKLSRYFSFEIPACAIFLLLFYFTKCLLLTQKQNNKNEQTPNQNKNPTNQKPKQNPPQTH